MKYAGMPFGMWMLFAGSFQKQLTAVLGYDAATARAVSYTHLDVYKRQAIREQIIRCGNRIKRTAHCASARKITARDQTGAEG